MSDPTNTWLAILSILSTLGLGVYVQLTARKSTAQANALSYRGQDLAELQSLRDDMAEMKKSLAEEQSFSRDMWIYCRNLLDLYYRNRKPGSPDPDPLPRDPRVL